MSGREPGTSRHISLCCFSVWWGQTSISFWNTAETKTKYQLRKGNRHRNKANGKSVRFIEAYIIYIAYCSSLWWYCSLFFVGTWTVPDFRVRVISLIRHCKVAHSQPLYYQVSSFINNPCFVNHVIPFCRKSWLIFMNNRKNEILFFVIRGMQKKKEKKKEKRHSWHNPPPSITSLIYLQRTNFFSTSICCVEILVLIYCIITVPWIMPGWHSRPS